MEDSVGMNLNLSLVLALAVMTMVSLLSELSDWTWK
jgi:hypothetical protein